MSVLRFDQQLVKSYFKFILICLLAFNFDQILPVRAQEDGIKFSSQQFSIKSSATNISENINVPVALLNISHCGTINSNQTWPSSDNVHVVTCNVIVAAGVTLTITEGAIVRFNANTRLILNGKLLVQGSAAAPVALTSYKDDGVTNCAPDDWDGIFFNPSSDDASLIDYAVIRCGGWANGYGGINLDDASPTIQNSEFRQNSYCSMVADLHSFPSLSGNNYVNNFGTNQGNGLCILPQAGETIDSDSTWNQKDTSYYVRNHVTVVLGKTLTISPGVVVKVFQDKRLIVNGKLLVLGTALAPVILTSYKDDEHGNGNNWDTNGGGASLCIPDDWDGIFFNPASDDTSRIDHAVIRCGGWANGYGGINLDDASPIIQNNEFRQNSYCSMVADLHSFPNLSGNNYVNNFGTNQGNGLCILPQAGETIDINATWGQTDTSYYIRNHVTVVLGKTLIINPGVVVKFFQDKRFTVNGKLLVQGTTPAPVILTSYRDDEYGNGNNRDTDGGGASVCVPDQWDGIFFSSTSDSTSLIDHAIIRCGGWANGYGGINFDHISPTIQNSKITKNAFAGLATNTSMPVLVNNCIESNANYGLYNATPNVTVNAKNQWWGDSSGPYHPIKNPNGLGNRVSDGVDFIPYLTSPCDAFRSQGIYDGWVLESTETSNQGGTMDSGALTFNLGDSASNQQYRAILHFNTAALPENAVITKIVLKIKKQGLVGTNPFATHGKIAVDIRKGAFSNNAALQLTDFQAAANKNTAGLIANNPQTGGWYFTNLNTTAFPFINLTGITQFRLRFQKDDNNDLNADFLKFHSGNATSAANRPVLIIEYYVP